MSTSTRLPHATRCSAGREQRIHPDDLELGFCAVGYVHDQIAGVESKRFRTQHFYNLEPDAKGRIELSFAVRDRAGHSVEVPVTLRVDENAPRRGGNHTWFWQDEFAEPASWISKAWWLLALPLLALAAFWIARTRRRRVVTTTPASTPA